jgi:N-terminal acetyltransferase 2
MVRNLIFRIPILRSLIPRVSKPLLPLSRFVVEPVGSLTRQGGRSSSRLFHHIPARLTNSRSPSPTSPIDPQLPPNASFSQRLKYLIKSYGWYALGVYIVIGTLDFGFAFAGVNILGAEYVARVAASVKEYVVAFLPAKPVEPGREHMDSAVHNVYGGSESLWAMVALAYTIHKTLFLPVRVGLTAAVTPRLVGWLRSRGWAGSAGTKRAANEMRERYRNRHSRD